MYYPAKVEHASSEDSRDLENLGFLQSVCDGWYCTKVERICTSHGAIISKPQKDTTEVVPTTQNLRYRTTARSIKIERSEYAVILNDVEPLREFKKL